MTHPNHLWIFSGYNLTRAMPSSPFPFLVPPQSSPIKYPIPSLILGYFSSGSTENCSAKGAVIVSGQEGFSSAFAPPKTFTKEDSFSGITFCQTVCCSVTLLQVKQEQNMTYPAMLVRENIHSHCSMNFSLQTHVEGFSEIDQSSK